MCEKNGLLHKDRDCFLCDEVSKDCAKCLGKWLPNEKGTCLSPNSYYKLWYNETDPELKKAYAIKISKCCD